MSWDGTVAKSSSSFYLAASYPPAAAAPMRFVTWSRKIRFSLPLAQPPPPSAWESPQLPLAAITRCRIFFTKPMSACMRPRRTEGTASYSFPPQPGSRARVKASPNTKATNILCVFYAVENVTDLFTMELASQSGVSQGQLSKVERRKVAPTVEVLLGVALQWPESALSRFSAYENARSLSSFLSLRPNDRPRILRPQTRTLTCLKSSL